MQFNKYDLLLRKLERNPLTSPLADYVKAGFMILGENGKLQLSTMGECTFPVAFTYDPDTGIVDHVEQLQNGPYIYNQLHANDSVILHSMNGSVLDEHVAKCIYEITGPYYTRLMKLRETYTRMFRVCDTTFGDTYFELCEIARDYIYGYSCFNRDYRNADRDFLSRIGNDLEEVHMYIGVELTKYWPEIANIDIDLTHKTISGIPQGWLDMATGRWGEDRLLAGLFNATLALVRRAQLEREKYQKALARYRKMRKILIIMACGGFCK